MIFDTSLQSPCFGIMQLHQTKHFQSLKLGLWCFVLFLKRKAVNQNNKYKDPKFLVFYASLFLWPDMTLVSEVNNMKLMSCKNKQTR